jgi:dipeptidyl aminopeptidase/acylaminoacyl peptidase
MRLVRELMRHDKRFDFMMMPGMRHGFGSEYNEYWRRCRAEYFARHLLGDDYRSADINDGADNENDAECGSSGVQGRRYGPGPGGHPRPRGGGGSDAGGRLCPAERFLTWNISPLLVNDTGSPNWIEDTDRFWYRVTREVGAEFMLVDPRANEHRLLFENDRLAAAMSMAADTTYDPVDLPFQNFELIENEQVIRFNVGDRRFDCHIVQYECTISERERPESGFSVSPDSTWEVFSHEYDLYLRPHGGGDTIQLTTDGEEFWQYGLSAPNAGQIRSGNRRTPNVQWSPDSRRIVTPRTDERGVEHMPMYSSTPSRPEAYSYPYALPGDSIIPRPHYYVIDIPDGTTRKLELDPELVFVSPAGGPDSTWAPYDQERLRMLAFTRGRHDGHLLEVDVATAEVNVLTNEHSDTFIDMSHGGPSNWAIANGGEDIIWFSQRDGWGHLYRFGPDGELKNQITRGGWVVAHIQYVDDDADRIYFTAWGREEGRNPYHAHLYRVNFDGSGLQLLTPEDGNHQISFSPGGDFFVDTYSQVDQPPVTVLRRASDGNVIRTLEETDISGLLEIGWRPPTPFKVKDRNGVHDIYGHMYRPSHFDPDRKYPIINFIYPGPQTGSTRGWGFTLEYWAARLQALSELGFVVLAIDHLGTPQRSKAFHDNYYGNLGENGIPDHIAAIRQLARQHSFMDLDRVGIYGGSGGGFASTRAIFEFPDVFHVAVSSAGNHDNRTYHYTWGEKYHGLLEVDEETGEDSYVIQSNAELAGNLEGKLFLIHGDLDDNVHPAMTLQVVHALVEANKTFDLLILPDRDHGMREPYVIRRTWDYFVRHLLGEEPPRDYHIAGPG